jgi:uncharacterized membrane protein
MILALTFGQTWWMWLIATVVLFIITLVSFAGMFSDMARKRNEDFEEHVDRAIGSTFKSFGRCFVIGGLTSLSLIVTIIATILYIIEVSQNSG